MKKISYEQLMSRTNDTDIRIAFHERNDAGEGFPVGDDDDRVDGVSVKEELSEMDCDFLGLFDCGNYAMFEHEDKDKIIIVANCNGPWAVEVQ